MPGACASSLDCGHGAQRCDVALQSDILGCSSRSVSFGGGVRECYCSIRTELISSGRVRMNGDTLDFEDWQDLIDELTITYRCCVQLTGTASTSLAQSRVGIRPRHAEVSST